MNNSVKKITYNLMTNSRMDLDFFMYLPNCIWGSRDHSSVKLNLNPVVYLRYKHPKGYASEYDFSKSAYKITLKNHFKVIKFFNTTVDWLFGDKYKDLFLYNDEGNLIFNADYGKLKVTMPVGDYTQQYMQAIPSIVRIGSKTYEGIQLYINKSDYCIPLTYEEVSMLFEILKEFSFTSTTSMVLTAYSYAEAHNSFGELPMQGKIKTPFD